MALPIKGSRTIKVSGQTFRWAVSPDSGYMWLIVEPIGGHGQRVEAHFEYRDQPLTPAIAREVILEAFKHGWQPSTRGLKPLRVEGEPLRMLVG